MQAQKAEVLTYNDLMNPDFWRAKFPNLSINSYLNSDKMQQHKLTPKTLDKYSEQIKIEGYFQEKDSELEKLSALISQGIKDLGTMGFPPPFIFLFDEPWACFYRQHETISHLLNNNYVVLPDFWAWHVNPAIQESGWRPHRDKGKMALLPDGTPLSLTMWIPITDATPLNGCIYCLPADRDPVYNTENEKNWQIDIPSIRALPAVPGEYLCWNQAILHWGARSHKRAENARMSIALEFQRSDMQPFNTPLIEPLANIQFPIRLKLIAKQILQYKHMYPLTQELQDVANNILGSN